MAEQLHTYRDQYGHTIYRKDKTDTMCRRCEPPTPMTFVATTERKDGESESNWKVRAIRAAKPS